MRLRMVRLRGMWMTAAFPWVTPHPRLGQALARSLVMEKRMLCFRSREGEERRNKVMKVNGDTRREKPRLAEHHPKFNPHHSLRM